VAEVAKRSVTASVHLPSAGAFQKAACYQGRTGSREVCTGENIGPLVNYSSTRSLGSGEQISVATALAKGAITVPPPMLDARNRLFPIDAFDITPLTVTLSLLIAVLGIGLVAWNWWAHGRDRAYLTQYYLTNDPRQGTEPLFRHDPLVVEFAPPQNMRPAQLGLILDQRTDAKDVTATIVDLAVRGYMTIKEVPEDRDWTFTWKAGSEASTLLRTKRPSSMDCSPDARRSASSSSRESSRLP